MIKTINLTGSEVRITELGGDNTEIFNNSNGIVYASKLPNITVGGDEVIAIPAGAIDGLYGTHGTVYLLGSGSVELRGIDHKITESRSQSVDGGVGMVQDYIDSKDAATLEAAQNYTDSITSELAGYIGYTDNEIFGLEADFENCVFTRLAGAVGKNAGADFDCVNAYGGRRRCNLSDSGEVLAYYGDENFKADGSNGQVMVEQPKFYYRVVPLKTEKIDGADGYHLRKARYYISDTPKPGFKVHPAFVENGKINDKIYLAAYDGCVYEYSSGLYCTDNMLVADFNTDKLSSISGAQPASGEKQNLTRANLRKLAHNRGNGWELSYMATVSATELLMLIEYASFNMQAAIGNGNTSQTADSANIKPTGRTNIHGNASGASTGSDNIQFITYRGEENYYGNIWAKVDGVNILNDAPISKCGKLYIADHDFADDTNSAPYEDTGIRPCSSNGYVSAFGYSKKYDWIFMATECKGNNAMPVGDFSYNSRPGWRTAMLGGCCGDGAEAGAFVWYLMHSSAQCYWSTGGRLVFIPSKAVKTEDAHN